MGCCVSELLPQHQLKSINITRKYMDFYKLYPSPQVFPRKNLANYLINLFKTNKHFPSNINIKTSIMDEKLLKIIHNESKGNIIRLECLQGSLINAYTRLMIPDNKMESYANFSFDFSDKIQQKGWDWYVPLDTEIINFNLTITKKSLEMVGYDNHIYSLRINIRTGEILHL